MTAGKAASMARSALPTTSPNKPVRICTRRSGSLCWRYAAKNCDNGSAVLPIANQTGYAKASPVWLWRNCRASFNFKGSIIQPAFLSKSLDYTLRILKSTGSTLYRVSKSLRLKYYSVRRHRIYNWLRECAWHNPMSLGSIFLFSRYAQGPGHPAGPAARLPLHLPPTFRPR